MQQASSLWQRWTSASNAAPTESSHFKNIASSPTSEINATPDLTSDKVDSNAGLDDDDDTADGSEKVSAALRAQLFPPIEPRLSKEGTRTNSASSGDSHQTFSSIPGPSERQSPVQNAAIQAPLSQPLRHEQQQQQRPDQRSAIGTSAAASNSNEDFFFERDPLLLPRRNHTIGAGTTPNRERINSHFLLPSEGPTSPGQNSLSAITGGRDTDDDEWEKAIKSREDLIPGEDDDLTNDNRYASGAIPWQINSSLAAASHRRFPSQPSSVRADSPYYSGNHSPLDSRGSYHQRSESAQVRRLEQGPFASASTIGHVPGNNHYANVESGMIRRHQSLNHTTGRAIAGRMQSSARRNLYADRIGAIDLDQLSPTASLTRETGNVSPEQRYVAAAAAATSLTPAERSIFANAGYIPPEAALDSNDTSSTTLSTSLLDAHARLSRMTLQPNTTTQQSRDTVGNIGPARESDGETKRQLHSLVTNRDILERSAMFGSTSRRGDIGGPASASAYVPPIGHGHHRRDQSPSNSPIGSLPKSDELTHRHALPALQGPFTALPGHAPWANQGGPPLLNKPSTMGIHHLEPAREESPRMDSVVFDSPSHHHQQLYQSEREDQHQSANMSNMAMNIALLQQRIISQQHHHIPTAHLHHQQQPQHHPLTTYNNVSQPAPLHFSMNGPRQSAAQLNPYAAISMDGPQYNRAYSPQIPNNLQSMFQSPLGNSSLPVKLGAPSASQTLNPALAAQISEKGYNPTPSQFDITAPRARFFVIKSFTEDDVQRSLKHEIWASTEKGNQRLDKAFKECVAAGDTPLYLFYSVNASGHFCGMAQMMSALDYTSTSNVWVQEGKWKGTFKVKWIFVKDVPNVKLRHIKLTNTVEQKAVTQSRDTQELPTEGGKEVLKIMAEYQSKTTLLQDWLFYEQQAAFYQQRKDGPSIES